MTIGQKDSVVPNGQAIRKDRQNKNLSQEALAANSDRWFSLSTVKRAEEGKRISKEKLFYIAAALGHSPEKYISQSSENLNPNINAENLRLGLLRFISLDEIRIFFGFLIATSNQNKNDTVQDYIFAEILKEIEKTQIFHSIMTHWAILQKNGISLKQFRSPKRMN